MHPGAAQIFPLLKSDRRATVTLIDVLTMLGLSRGIKVILEIVLADIETPRQVCLRRRAVGKGFSASSL